ncbi:transferase family protein [Medicago truncatula]|uniref:Transferase family protein n=1 Tax=Medicago truncatula TaxID=3880 RepID=A0A072UXQ0_MEDTR|nr:transferase family protein [Medicago truncatula]
MVTDYLTRAKFREVNFGWGEAKYGGVAKAGAGGFRGATIIVPHKNSKQEKGLILPISLPYEDMKRFAKELDEMLGNHHPTTRGHSSITSSL